MFPVISRMHLEKLHHSFNNTTNFILQHFVYTFEHRDLLVIANMATPELAIAKATLSATLFRADPTSLSRPSVEAFFSLLTDALAQCSRPNVQVCSIA